MKDILSVFRIAISIALSEARRKGDWSYTLDDSPTVQRCLEHFMSEHEIEDSEQLENILDEELQKLKHKYN